MTPRRLPSLLLFSLFLPACAEGLEAGRTQDSGQVAAGESTGAQDDDDDGSSTGSPIDSTSSTSSSTSGDSDPSTTSTGGDTTSGTTVDPTDGTTGDDDGSTGSTVVETTGDDSTGGELVVVDLSGFTVRQTDSNREFTIPGNTLLLAGQSLLIIRGAPIGSFESFWNADISGALVVEGNGEFPAINGGETYTLLDDAGQLVDGPSPVLELGNFFERAEPVEDSEWTGGPASGATPGEGHASDGDATPYIARAADAPGNGTFDNEFIEIRLR